ncbi:MAG TPA: hypothetical protein VFS67_16385 [Polyangiaceae bacterium]|nr:hypothetical protein [Polyangiaceae bacterium]
MRGTHHLASALLALACALSGCSGCGSYRRCSAPPAPRLAALPARLSETGLFADGAADTLGPGVRAYAPAYPLWSDGASKRRWFSLPEGSRIDSSDLDDWVFPVGTRFWKEFSLGGKRVETRLLVKVGAEPGDWAGAAYLWDDDQREARLAPEGSRDLAGTGYVVPSAAECAGCHGGRRSYVLGFSAVQLAPAELPLSLAELTSEGLLTQPPEQPPRIPGDARQHAALGYLHANCGHCHNSARPPHAGPRCYDPHREIDFWLPAAPAAGPGALRTTVPRYLTPGDPDDSRLVTLISRRGKRLHMPPLGSQRVDEQGVQLLSEWIESLR